MPRRIWNLVGQGWLTEGIRLALLAAVAVYAIQPFLSAHFLGQGDARWYYCLLADFLAQVRAGVFPVYVGQTMANWNGFPVVLAPGYLYTGAALDLLTGGRYSPLEIQHLTLLISAAGGAFSMYFCLAAVLPGQRWAAFFLAVLYVCCPGVLTLPYAMDMYPSFMTLPYVPLLLLGLVRGVRQRDGWSAAAIAAALTLLWLSHAPIALWATTLTAAFFAGRAAFGRHRRETLLLAARTGAVFAALSAWYFCSVFALDMHRACTLATPNAPPPSAFAPVRARFVEKLLPMLELAWPGAYLPLGKERLWHADLQLGYPLWAVVLFSVAWAWRRRARELRVVLGLVGLLMAFLVPLPYLTGWLWSHLPRCYEITTIWPMERFYVLLAALACFAAALALAPFLAVNRWYLAVRLAHVSGEGKQLIQVALNRAGILVLLGGGALWGLSEVGKLRTYGFAGQDPTNPPRVTLAENQPLYGYAWLNLGHPHYPSQVYDPVLQNRVIQPVGNQWRTVADNDATLRPADVIRECGRTGMLPTVPSVCGDQPFPFVARGVAGLVPLMHFRLEPGRRYVLSLAVHTINCCGYLHLDGTTLHQIDELPRDAAMGTFVNLPVWTSLPRPQDIQVAVSATAGNETKETLLFLTPLALRPYDSGKLPIRVTAMVPYTAAVQTGGPGSFLETHRQFVPGYQAYVNGCRTPVLRSADDMVLVPLQQGANVVKLVYRGTKTMQWALAMSTLGWLGLLGAIARRLWRNRERRVAEAWQTPRFCDASLTATSTSKAP